MNKKIHEHMYIEYIHNTDGVVNLAPCIHRGRPFADPGSRGRRLPRPWVCKQASRDGYRV